MRSSCDASLPPGCGWWLQRCQALLVLAASAVNKTRQRRHSRHSITCCLLQRGICVCFSPLPSASYAAIAISLHGFLGAPGPALQKKDGAVAVGLARSEFAHLFAQVQRDVAALSADDPEAFPLGRVIWSLDNASAHMDIIRGLPSDQKNVIPATSPDIHKVVEHPLNAFNNAWYPEFTASTRCTTCESSMTLAAEILRRTTADSIWRDLQTLPDTLRSIIQHGGDWADADLC